MACKWPREHEKMLWVSSCHSNTNEHCNELFPLPIGVALTRSNLHVLVSIPCWQEYNWHNYGSLHGNFSEKQTKSISMTQVIHDRECLEEVKPTYSIFTFTSMLIVAQFTIAKA